jgi:hypothetical protein
VKSEPRFLRSCSTGRLSSPLRRLSIDSDLAGPPADPAPIILILAMVSGLGDRRISSGRSRMGDEGAEELNVSEPRLSGSGRLNGAGSDVARAASRGGGGRE